MSYPFAVAIAHFVQNYSPEFKRILGYLPPAADFVLDPIPSYLQKTIISYALEQAKTGRTYWGNDNLANAVVVALVEDTKHPIANTEGDIGRLITAYQDKCSNLSDFHPLWEMTLKGIQESAQTLYRFSVVLQLSVPSAVHAVEVTARDIKTWMAVPIVRDAMIPNVEVHAELICGDITTEFSDNTAGILNVFGLLVRDLALRAHRKPALLKRLFDVILLLNHPAKSGYMISNEYFGIEWRYSPMLPQTHLAALGLTPSLGAVRDAFTAHCNKLGLLKF